MFTNSADDIEAQSNGELRDDLETTSESQGGHHISQESTAEVSVLRQGSRNLSANGTVNRRLPFLLLQTLIDYRFAQNPDITTSHYHLLANEQDEVVARNFRITTEPLAISRFMTEELVIYSSKEWACCGLYRTELVDIETWYPGLRAFLAPTITRFVSMCERRPSRNTSGNPSSGGERQLSQQVKWIPD